MIWLNNISKIYSNKGIITKALSEVSLTINKGDFLMIQGQSGSGKTTLLNILGLMDYGTGGEYIFKGRNISELNNHEISRFRNREIGFIFQAFNLVNSMNVIDNVEIPLGYRGVGRKTRRELATNKLIEVGLQDKIKSYPTHLSGGQQQRVSIARALVGEPELILADEPTGNLDSQTSEEIMDLLVEIHKQGRTIIMITHNQELTKHASRIGFMKDGKLELM